MRSNAHFTCRPNDYLCVKYREHCISEKLPFSDCGGEKYRKCGKRNGAKYQNNQCYDSVLSTLRSKTQSFQCLNRKDIDEKVLAKSAIFHTADKRLDLFQYFTNHNDTHIICGDQALRKVECGLTDTILTPVQCKKKDSDIEEKTFSHIDICKDSFFMKKMGYTEKEINLPKKNSPWPNGPLAHPYFAPPSSCDEDTSRYFFCKKSQQCIDSSYGNTACGKFRGGVLSHYK